MRSLYLIPFLLLPIMAAADVSNVTVDHDHVVTLARKLAAAPYDPDRGSVPQAFLKMDYDDYRRIRFRPEDSLWIADNLPFRVQFYHPGYIYDRSVDLHEFSNGYMQDIPFARDHFDYQDLHVPFWAKWGLGYAGFRLLNQLNQPGKWDEVISFLGASYFRALAKGQFYGISARGLSLNAGGPGAEEFPRFTEFWLGKPKAEAKAVTVHALLDGPSVAGAYTFVVRPGVETVVEVEATLFFRSVVQTVGLAPMTSMFWFGEGSADHHGDFRPEVHDSDGLLVAPDEATRIWRPLTNPTEMNLVDFPTARFAGFGLMQRDRDFHDYEDLEAHYEHRPSLWMEPVGPWPEGRVRLLELPTADEQHDNVVAFWTPAQPPEPDAQPLELSWRLHWTNAPAFGGPPGRVVSTRRTVQDGAPGRTHFIIEFTPGSPRGVKESQPPVADVQTPEGVQVVEKQVIRNEIDGLWRLSLRLAAKPGAPAADIRARLLVEGKPLTETWDMSWKP
jgi:glucans biosynthesis protein